MRTPTLSQLKASFTYGFELEGYSARETMDRIRKRGFNVEEKDDGSVDSLSSMTESSTADDIENGIYEYNINCNEPEMAIGVFPRFKSMLTCLSWFRNDKNYFSNESCGLHVHIKPISIKRKHRELRHIVASAEFLDRLRDWGVKNLCPCTQARLKLSDNRSYYCQPYELQLKTDSENLEKSLISIGNVRARWRNEEKYQMVRNHPSGTLEFRFFSACKHKADNVERFFDFFFKELRREKKRHLKRELEVEVAKTILSKNLAIDIPLGVKRSKLLELRL